MTTRHRGNGRKEANAQDDKTGLLFSDEVPNRPQVTIIQSDNYGPWTVSPSPRREMDLQRVQADLHSHLATMIGTHGGYVLGCRGDHLLAITNGMGMEDLKRVQRSVNNTFPFSVSMTTHAARTPAESIVQASHALQNAGSAQDSDRIEVLKGTCAPEGSVVHVAHFDIIDVTGKLTDSTNVYTATVHIEEWAIALQKILWNEVGAIGSFVGGDNAICLMPRMDTADYEDILDRLEDETGLPTRVGVGVDQVVESAGLEAKHALEVGREEEERVVAPSLASEGTPRIDIQADH